MIDVLEMPQFASHAVTAKPFDQILQQTTARLKQQGDKPYATVAQQLALLRALTEFDFGRFLLQHQGLNGYWTHYMLTHPWFGKKTGKNNRKETFSPLENFLLNEAPMVLAAQQRFQNFLKENQQQVKNGAVLASVPCGLLSELLYLDFSQTTDVELVGIDYDAATLAQAELLAIEKNAAHFTKLMLKDAWQLNLPQTFDLISSNGLNIYINEPSKIAALYQQFYHALKPNGKLVTSFFTYPPNLTPTCEWDLTKVNPQHLQLQQILAVDIIAAKFLCFSSSAQMRTLLTEIGYQKIEIIYDQAKIAPTVVAYK